MDKNIENRKRPRSKEDLELDYTDLGTPVHLDHNAERHKTQFKSYQELEDFTQQYMENKKNI